MSSDFWFKVYCSTIKNNSKGLKVIYQRGKPYFFHQKSEGIYLKAWSLAGFWKIENSGGSGTAPVKWLPLWRPCLPKIYCGGPKGSIIFPSWFTVAIFGLQCGFVWQLHISFMASQWSCWSFSFGSNWPNVKYWIEENYWCRCFCSL